MFLRPRDLNEDIDLETFLGRHCNMFGVHNESSGQVAKSVLPVILKESLLNFHSVSMKPKLRKKSESFFRLSLQSIE
jgi:hypothetical protein